MASSDDHRHVLGNGTSSKMRHKSHRKNTSIDPRVRIDLGTYPPIVYVLF